MKKYDFQDEAVDWLFEKTLDPASKKTIVLNAPTGSGKTVILIKYIDRLLAVKRNIAVVWLCPGKGDLEEQSRGSFDYFLPSRQSFDLNDALTSGFEAGSTMASMINTFMSSLIMDFDFESSYKLDFNTNYMPSPMLTEYIGGMYKTEILKQQYMEILGQTTLLESELIELNRKIDREILVTGISFMQIQAILLLMESSKLYPVYVSKIAKSILLIFKEMLADSRIEKIEIDSAISAGVIRQGIRKTTGMKIFFALENSDRYCLRIDFPHEGAEYLHLNLHEPHRQTAIPLNYKQYSMLKKQYGDLSNLFFNFGNMYWFRYDFIEKLNKCSLIEGCENNNSSFIADIKAVFFRQSHYRLFDDNITKDNMVDFIAEFGKALIHTQIYETSYFCTEIENIDDKLTKIKLRDIFISAFALYQRFYLEEKIFQKSYKIGYDKLKEKLLNALFTSFSSEVAPLGEYAEFEEMRLEDIFSLLYDIVNDSKS